MERSAFPRDSLIQRPLFAVNAAGNATNVTKQMSGTAMAWLLLVRHAQTLFPSDSDSLSSVGERQARLAGDYLSRIAPRMTHILSGSLARQIHTAEAISDRMNVSVGLPVQVDARLNEPNFDAQIEYFLPADGATAEPLRPRDKRATMSSRQYQGLLKRAFSLWQDSTRLPPDLESWPAFSARVGSILNDFRTAEAGQVTIAVTSGGVIATIVQQVLALPAVEAYSLLEVMMNCSVTRLQHDRKRFSLASFNDCSYLAERQPEARPDTLLTFR